MQLVRQTFIVQYGPLFMQQINAHHYNLSSQQQLQNARQLQKNSLFEVRLDSTIVLGALMGCWYGPKKPLSTQCDKVRVDSGKFFCGWKGKYGLNLQGVCDAKRRLTYISVQHPAMASDYLAFVTSSLYQQLTEGSGLPSGFCLYGDNAYVNESYMCVPFPNTSSGTKDAYNYYQSQLQINIECAFGILTNRWRILKSPLNANIPINRVKALVSCLCKIHNFCINNGNAKPPQRYPHDALTLMDFINDTGSENARPLGLLGGGEHFDDIPQGQRGANQRSQRLANQRQPTEDTIIPCNDMLQHVIT